MVENALWLLGPDATPGTCLLVLQNGTVVEHPSRRVLRQYPPDPPSTSGGGGRPAAGNEALRQWAEAGNRDGWYQRVQVYRSAVGNRHRCA